MTKILEVFSYILKENLSNYFLKHNTIDPIELNKQMFITRGVFVATIIFIANNQNNREQRVVFAANKWFKENFHHENLFSKIIGKSNNYLNSLIENNISNIIGIELISLPTLYENLLSVELSSDKKITKTRIAKNYRNKLGSYYTPLYLAQIVTEETIDTFFEINFDIKNLSKVDTLNLSTDFLEKINTISFVDFSCGGGVFLVEVINYFEKLLSKINVKLDFRKKILESIALNISAFDVDCLALEVAKINLLLKIERPHIYKKMSLNFTHANFLLPSFFKIDESKKLETFSSGFIYHEYLSLDSENLKKYDIILGNPPWEKIRFEEKKFYALYSNSIASQYSKAKRTNEIALVERDDIKLALFSKQFKTEIEKAKADIKKNPFFNLSNKGELNTYTLFTDAAIKLRTERGVVGLILKSGIITSQINKKIFGYITKSNLVIRIFDFINRKKIFNIDSRERFCFLLLGKSKQLEFFVSMNLKEINDIKDKKEEIILSYEDLLVLNPLTGMLPNFTNKKEVDFILRVSKDYSFFKNVYSKVRFGRIVHFTSHSAFITKGKNNSNIPIYEGKFFNQFDGKYSGFNNVTDDLRYGNKSSSIPFNEQEKLRPDYVPESRFFIDKEKWLKLSRNHSEEYMLVWRSLTSATNRRTCIATILPFIPASQSVQFLTTNQNELLYLTGLFNSIVFDFILKKKLSGIDLTQTIINQMPIPKLELINKTIEFEGITATIKEHIELLVFSLLKDDVRLNSLFKNLEFIKKNATKKTRQEIIRDIDLLFILLYGVTNVELQLFLPVFNKQYSANDFNWFVEQVRILNKTIGSTCSFVPHFTPN